MKRTQDEAKKMAQQRALELLEFGCTVSMYKGDDDSSYLVDYRKGGLIGVDRFEYNAVRKCEACGCSVPGCW